ncbi:MAG: threonine/serine exporter family protein [Clostridia bacterium]|nr:threonine/serine exporter family protein [Clostridia bacterium]
MTQNEYERLMTAIMDMGKTMLTCGAEIYRVEDTITRLIKAYGGTSWQVNAVPSHILASATFDGREYSLMRRIDQSETDLELLHRVNDLSRRICSEKPSPERIQQMLEKARNGKKYTDIQLSLIYALTGGMFTMFFGGIWRDALVSAFTSGSLYWVRRLILKNGGNRVFVALLCSAYAALLTKLLVYAGIGMDADKIIIGIVMVLIPGVEMLNGLRDFSVGDIQAGLMHLGEALFLGVIIAAGAAGMLMLVGSFGV